jgi:hypothetical protein
MLFNRVLFVAVLMIVPCQVLFDYMKFKLTTTVIAAAVDHA